MASNIDLEELEREMKGIFDEAIVGKRNNWEWEPRIAFMGAAAQAAMALVEIARLRAEEEEKASGLRVYSGG